MWVMSLAVRAWPGHGVLLSPGSLAIVGCGRLLAVLLLKPRLLLSNRSLFGVVAG